MQFNYLTKFMACLLPIVAIVYVSIYGVNFIFWDELRLVDLFNEKIDFWSSILEPNNEHCIPLGKLEYYVIEKMTSMNAKALMYVSILTLCIPYFLFLKKIQTKNLFLTISSVIIFYLAFFSPIGWENLLSGFQLLFINAYAFAIIAVLLCDTFLATGKLRYLYISSCCCCMASLSSSHGLLSWISIILVMLYSRKYKKCLLPLYPMIFVIAFYFIILFNRVFNGNHGTTDYSFLSIAKYFLTFVSSWIGGMNPEIGWLIGLLVVAFLCYLLICRKMYKDYLVTTLVLLGIMVASMVTFGRWTLGIGQALSSRYFLLQMPVYLAFGVILTKCKFQICNVYKTISVILTVSVFVIIFLVMSVKSIEITRIMNNVFIDRLNILLTFDQQPKSVIEQNIFPNYDYAKHQISIIKAKKLNAFAEE